MRLDRARSVGMVAWIALAAPVCAHADQLPDSNRFAAVGVGYLRQSYRELDDDGLSPSGVLDAESGTLSRIQASARWRGEPRAFPLLLQVRIERTRGPTAYSGYIRYRDGLVPLLATTRNTMRYDEVLCGLPVRLGTEAQVTPLVGVTWWSWRRQLLEYTERYRHKAFSLGFIAQQRLAPVVLETQLLAGRTSAAHVAIDEEAWRAASGQPRGARSPASIPKSR